MTMLLSKNNDLFDLYGFDILLRLYWNEKYLFVLSCILVSDRFDSHNQGICRSDQADAEL